MPAVHPGRVAPHPIEVARFLRGLSQRELALQAGISREGLSLVETFERSPRLVTMTAISKALGVDIGTLFDGTDLSAERLAALAGDKPAVTS